MEIKVEINIEFEEMENEEMENEIIDIDNMSDEEYADFLDGRCYETPKGEYYSVNGLSGDDLPF
jgi:hypothetical protein